MLLRRFVRLIFLVSIVDCVPYLLPLNTFDFNDGFPSSLLINEKENIAVGCLCDNGSNQCLGIPISNLSVYADNNLKQVVDFKPVVGLKNFSFPLEKDEYAEHVVCKYEAGTGTMSSKGRPVLYRTCTYCPFEHLLNCLNKTCTKTKSNSVCAGQLTTENCDLMNYTDTEVRVCSEAQAGSKSFCHGLVDGKKPLYYENSLTACDTTGQFWFLDPWNGKPILMGDHVATTNDSNRVIKVNCGSQYTNKKCRQLILECNNQNCVEIETDLGASKCADDVKLNMAVFPKDKYASHRIRLSCIATGGGPSSAKTYAYFFVFKAFNNMTHVENPPEGSTCSFGCSMSDSSGFKRAVKVFKNGEMVPQADDKIVSIAYVKEVQNDDVMLCNYTMIVGVCGPYGRTYEYSETKNYTFKGCTAVPKKQGLDLTSKILLFTIIPLVCIVIILIAIIILRKKGFLRSKRAFLNKELEKECKASSRFNYNLQSKVAQAADANVGTSQQADTFFQSNIATDKGDEAKDVQKIPGCMTPAVLCMKRTQVKCKGPVQLNTNQLNDFFNFPAFLGQTPKPAEFEAFWQTVFEKNVSVYIWINDSKQGPFHVPVKQFSTEKYGAYLVRNVVSIAWLTQFKVHELSYIKGDDFKNQKGKALFAIEVFNWPSAQTPKEPDKLLRLLEDVDSYRKMQRSQDDKLKGIMVHCKDGVGQSATFLATYIARQMWQVRNETNPVGVMRYIRKCRFGAFSKSEKPGAQVRILFALMRIFKTAGGPKKVPGAKGDAAGSGSMSVGGESAFGGPSYAAGAQSSVAKGATSEATSMSKSMSKKPGESTAKSGTGRQSTKSKSKK